MILVTISTYTFPHDMVVDRSKLEAHGIECFSRDELTAQVNNFYSNAIGGIKLQVWEKDVDRARQILSDTNNLKADYSDAKVKCPQCQSGNIDGLGLLGRISMVILFLTALPVPVFSSKFRCYDCGNIFKLKKKRRK